MTSQTDMRTAKCRLACILAGALMPAGPALAQEDLALKLLELQTRIEQLSRRVEILEAQAAANADTGPGVRLGKDLAWHFDAYLAQSPFQVSQQELDRKTGQVDLLLLVAAAPPDLDLWQAVAVGSPVPVEVTATLAGGGTLGPIPFTLHRRTTLGVGTQVHLVAQLGAPDPKAVRRLALRHQGGG